MTHEFDPLENELAALRPVEPTAELTERIGARLKADATSVVRPSPGGFAATLSRRERVLLALAGAVIAACVLVAVVLWRSDRDIRVAEPPLDSPQLLLANTFDESLPSVWTYRSALGAPEALDALLDQHASRPRAADDPVQTRGFGSLSVDLNSRLGGL